MSYSLLGVVISDLLQGEFSFPVLTIFSFSSGKESYSIIFPYCPVIKEALL
jgi:hypothetical protein